MENVDGEIVGQIVTFDCDKRMGNFKFGLFVLPAYQGGGYAKEAVNIVLDYYFNHLRYHKANVYIYDCNEKSQKFHQSLGFVREGVLRETAFFDGEYHDTVYYGIIDREFNGRK
jgi:RimJ/RimL family protein N-acetyltransferase